MRRIHPFHRRPARSENMSFRYYNVCDGVFSCLMMRFGILGGFWSMSCWAQPRKSCPTESNMPNKTSRPLLRRVAVLANIPIMHRRIAQAKPNVVQISVVLYSIYGCSLSRVRALADFFRPTASKPARVGIIGGRRKIDKMNLGSVAFAVGFRTRRRATAVRELSTAPSEIGVHRRDSKSRRTSG